MKAIRIVKQLDSPIKEIPELDAFVGRKVEIIALAEDASINSIDRKRRIAGTMKGKLQMASDFDAPLEEFREYTE